MRSEFNHCPNRFRFRGSIEELPYCNGGFAEYYYLFPGHFVFKVPDELPDEVTTSVNCAVSQVIYGLEQGGAKMGDSIVIQGAGGLGINAAAAEMGPSAIIVIDGIEARLELARQCGATHTININEIPDKSDRVEHVKKITHGRGADIGLEVVGYPEVVNEGISMLRNGGSYVEIGNIWDNSNATIDMSKMVWGMNRLIGVAHYNPYIIPVALDFLVRTQNRFPLTKIISHKFRLDEISEAFEKSEWSGKNSPTELTRAILVP
jgi:threonine dehydrogenase-like Zn-dependent dehydrogenase